MSNFEVSSLTNPASGDGDDRLEIVAGPDGVTIILADGAGGSGGGGEAAAMLVGTAADECSRNGVPQNDLACCELLTRLDRLIAEDKLAGETTAVIVVLTQEELYGASVGDSRAWLVFPDEWYDLTSCQSRKPLVGCDMAIPEPFNAELRDGILVVATDGLWNYVDQDKILNTVRAGGLTSADITKKLVDAARLPNGGLCDDITVVVCKQGNVE